MRRLQIAASAGAVIAAAWLLMFPVPDTQTYVRPPVMQSPVEEPKVFIIFGGDMMFDRTIRTTMEEKGGDYIFSCINGLLQNADLVVANLEGPITSEPSRSVGTKVGGEGNFTFTFPASTATLLARHNIRLVSLGNNHILNFGKEGERSTVSYLAAAGVGYFGDTWERTVAHLDIRGIKLAFITYNEFAPVEHTNILKNVGMSSTTLAQIRAARAFGEIPVVYAHWGDEYVQPPERVKQLARSFVDAGADIVIGSHPHIVQGREYYGGRYIYYSLGNFVFDQYWNESVRRGLLLRVEFSPNGVESIEEIPIDNQTDRRTCAV